MPSSTSSSDLTDFHLRESDLAKAPAQFGIRFILAVIIMYGLAILVLETGWRYVGIEHYSVTDDVRLWSMQRERLDSDDGHNMVALLGGSRMQIGFSREAFRELLPDTELVRLSVAGKKPIAALKDIALNTRFRGTAIVAAYTMALTPRGMKDQQPYVDYYHNEWGVDARINRKIKTLVEENLVLVNPRYKTSNLLLYIAGQGARPKIHHVTITRDRSIYADYSSIPAQADRNRHKRLGKIRKKQPPPPSDLEKWLAESEKIKPYVRKIQDRGGKVVFVRFPITYSDWLETYEIIRPKHKYWDAFAEDTQAAMIHFADYPTLHFNAPDGSHIDQRDAPQFTRNLLKILDDKHLIRGGNESTGSDDDSR